MRPLPSDRPVVDVALLRAAGVIDAGDQTVMLGFGEVEREARLIHHRFPNGGSWSFFLCPNCLRKCRTLKLADGQVVCDRCKPTRPTTRGGVLSDRIARMNARLNVQPAPRCRSPLEPALRRALIKLRWKELDKR